MNILNIEIKSSINDPNKVISLLEKKAALFIGEDHQTDTYFSVKLGRLKLRQGNIENALIYYYRPESKNLKRSEVKLQELPKNSQGIRKILKLTHGIKATVKKVRKIYFIDNVKFHVDHVMGLGSFVEIEASDSNGRYTELDLNRQCEFYIEYLGLNKDNFIDMSYCDFIINKAEPKNKEELQVTY